MSKTKEYKIKATLVHEGWCSYDRLRDEDNETLFRSLHIRDIKEELGVKEGDQVQVTVKKIRRSKK